MGFSSAMLPSPTRLRPNAVILDGKILNGRARRGENMSIQKEHVQQQDYTILTPGGLRSR